MSSPTNDNSANANSTSQMTSSTRCQTNAVDNGTDSPPPAIAPAPGTPLIDSSANVDDVDHDPEEVANLAITIVTELNIENDNNVSTSSEGIDEVEQMNGAMTDAAIIETIVAKKTKEVPSLDQIGVNDPGPTPYTEVPDVEGEAGKSLAHSINHPDQVMDGDDDARPFDSREFEYGSFRKKIKARGVMDTCIAGDEEEGVGGVLLREGINDNQDQDDNEDNSELNAARPRDEAVMLPTLPPPRSMLPNDEESVLHLEATLVPHMPVYNGVPVQVQDQEPSEEPRAWYRQNQAKAFFAFMFILFITGAIVIWWLSSSSTSNVSSSSTTVVTVVSVISAIPSMSFGPSMAPSTTSRPSTTPSSSLPPSSSPTNTCFDTRELLGGAISSYAKQGCTHNNTNCKIGHTYGYPMNSWCVGQITDMSSLFSGKHDFNEDLSGWDVSSVTRMHRMFYEATAFNSDLSRWDVSAVTNMRAMFAFNSVFNIDVSGWEVSSVTDMAWMFQSTYEFNSDLSGWNISSVKTMDGMFDHASVFNQSLCSWGDNFPYKYTLPIYETFTDSGCTFQGDPTEQDGGPFCASSCSKP